MPTTIEHYAALALSRGGTVGTTRMPGQATGRPIFVPIRVVSELNVREHWAKKAARAKAQRTLTTVSLIGLERPSLPVVVTLTRIGGRHMDDDNLAGAFKAVRDAVAKWIGVDDRHRDQVRYECDQRPKRRGEEPGVIIEIGGQS